MTAPPLRIALYVPALAGGGAERAAAVLASGFREAGCRVRLFVDFDAPENRGFLDPAVTVTALGRGHGAAVRALAGHLRARRHDSAEGLDVVLAVGGAANVKLTLARLLARASVPVVLSYHGRSDVGRGLLGGLAFRFAPVLTRLAARSVCVSQALARHLVEDWRGAAARIAVIPNAVPVEAALPAADAAALLARPPVILSVGRLAPEKEFPTLIRAFARLPGEPRLVILGEGPDRAALEALAGSLGLGDRVALPGYAASPWPAYAGARVFALSSRSEGFGNVVVEALASGLPVVATDCGGPREILDDGRHGALVPVGDEAALAAALAEALERPGEPGPRRDRAARYATGRVVADYLALFGEVGRGHGGLSSSPGPA
ncbi:glycosyltransferase [uncultured Methylobacterium sp.]|uniref:glycosyltransferase n=1 Tax=uncultured Methylobacterium sp. TaxID=157278 RepID=UPI00260705A7|nr:glycosyltransferase [uncultured Methylobacterium sp.]